MADPLSLNGFDPGNILRMINPLRAAAGSPSLSQSEEKQFQMDMAGFDPAIRDWAQKFKTVYGESPNTQNDPQFDYRAAWKAGNRPHHIDTDIVPHWDSRGKAADHPTEWMEQFMQKFGVDPMSVQKPTPEMNEWLRERLPLPQIGP